MRTMWLTYPGLPGIQQEADRCPWVAALIANEAARIWFRMMRLTILSLALTVAATCSAAPPAPPQPQLVLPVRYVYAVDGDTLDCDVTIRVRVRLLAGNAGCWAPESNTPEGKSAAQSLKLAIAGAGGNVATGVIQIPLRTNRLQDVFTFGRVLANCYVDGQEKSLGEQQIALGLASSKKGGELGR